MLIKDTIKIEGAKYSVESHEDGYKITSPVFIGNVYQDSNGIWCADNPIPLNTLSTIGQMIEELIWFRANGI
jgi:hypothetical protein